MVHRLGDRRYADHIGDSRGGGLRTGPAEPVGKDEGFDTPEIPPADWLLPVIQSTERVVATLRRNLDRALGGVQVKLLEWQTARDPAVAEWVVAARRATTDGTTAKTASTREEILRSLEALHDPGT
jgi:hypothetical protein